MRVRYQMAGQMSYTAECDLATRKAKALFNSLKKEPECEWAELVGEDDDDYMDILDSFDHPDADRIHAMMESLRKAFG